MNAVSIYGAGMLIGCALIIVIPEAVQVIINATTYDENDASHIAEHDDNEGVIREGIEF